MPTEIELTLENDNTAVTQLADAVEAFGEDNDLPFKLLMELSLVLDELVTNAFKHGYGDAPGTVTVRLGLRDRALVEVEVSDRGPAFDPLSVPAPDTSSPLEAREPGGLGIHLVRKLMDDVRYRRTKERNVVTLTRRIGPVPQQKPS